MALDAEATLTTEDELDQALGDALVVAQSVLAAVEERASGAGCWRGFAWWADDCAAHVELAGRNVESVFLLADLIDEALAEEPARAAEVFAQAAVVLDATAQQSARLAAWAGSSQLMELSAETWSALGDVLATAAYEVASTVVVVGERVAEGLGWRVVAGIAGVLGVGALAFLASKRA